MRRPLFFVCLCLVAIAALRLWWSPPGRETEALCPENGQSVTVSGRICSKDKSSFLLDSIVLLSDAADSRQEIQTFINQKWICEYEMLSPGKVSAGEMPEKGNASEMPRQDNTDEMSGKDNIDTLLKIGSTVTVSGTFYNFRPASNPGEFDTQAYYRTLGITGRLKESSVLSAGSRYSRWRETLYSIRQYFQNRLYAVFPEKEASILSAMLLGEKGELDREVKELYKRNGIIHILSISGLHITLIGMGLYKLLRRLGLPLWISAVCAGCVLLLYGVLTGMGVSACRAIGMFVIRMGAEVIGRSYDMQTAVGVMAVILVWENPWYLCHAGFLLSFASVLGIALLAPVFEHKRGKGAAAGIAVTLFTMPVQLWFYYEIPVWSLFLNLLILPFMSAVVATGIFVMILPGSGLLGTVTCLILKGYELLCLGFEKLPFHTWNPGSPAVWQVVVYYLIMLGISFWRQHRKPPAFSEQRITRIRLLERNRIVIAFLKQHIEKIPFLESRMKKNRAPAIRKIVAVRLFALLAVLIFAVKIPADSRITFLDVGQGDCILLEMKTGETYLFDCGSSSRTKVGKYVLLPYLKSRGIRQIDAVFVSHADSDHCNGIIELLGAGEEEGILVRQLVLPAVAEKQREQEFAKLTEAAGQETVISYISAGMEWKQGELEIICLNPPKGCDTQDSNAYSECFYVKIGSREKGTAELQNTLTKKEIADTAKIESVQAETSKTETTFSVLLTGDVAGTGEFLLTKELTRRNIQSVDILKVAHHGSAYSTKEDFLKAAHPRIAVISCGVNNRYGHPHAETLDRLHAADVNIYRTPQSGAVIIKIKKDTIRTETYLQGEKP